MIKYDPQIFVKNKASAKEVGAFYTRNLHGGYILGTHDGHLRLEVYKRGQQFQAILHQIVGWDNEIGWIIGEPHLYIGMALESVFNRAGYSSSSDGWDGWDGWQWLTHIGDEFSDGYKIYNFGRL